MGNTDESDQRIEDPQAPSPLTAKLDQEQMEAIERAMVRLEKDPAAFGLGPPEVERGHAIGALPVARYGGQQTLYIRRDGEVLVDERGLASIELRVQRRHRAMECAARLFPELGFLRPVRPESGSNCKSCKASGDAAKKSTWSIDLGEAGNLCGDCVGRGWRRAPLREHDNPLSRLWGSIWQDNRFRLRFLDEPKEVLTERGLAIGDEIAVNVMERVADTNNPELSDPRYLCPYCQLSVPWFAVNSARCRCDPPAAEARPSSQLQDLFAACRSDDAFLDRFMKNQVAVLYEKGLDMPDNVIVRVWDGSPSDPRLFSLCASCQEPRASISFILGLCTCDEPDLADLIDWG